MSRISWHPAFVQAIQHELEEYLDCLTFESEHQLTTEPLKIDVLIIKKEKDVVIEKNIAQIFRRFNVVEYKSPRDHVTIEDYHKTQCYARLYAALNKADINEMSVTVVATRHPRKLLAFLKKQYAVGRVQLGIYLVERDTCPTQVIVSEELPEDDNLWLNSLREDLTADRLERVAMSAGKRLPLDAYIQVIGEANIKAMEDLQMKRKNGVILSEKLDAYFTEKYGADFIAIGKAEGIAEGKARGKTEGKTEGIAESVLVAIRKKFKKVPKQVERSVLSKSEPTELESLLERVFDCNTVDEFAKVFRMGGG
ncbi:MAG: hypothetical protein LBI05_05955 [Planctomycetaceae bacterium]|jgi:hypothetical protein|nr:hypothetical protein [Planctomycetaceae bacterium]